MISLKCVSVSAHLRHLHYFKVSVLCETWFRAFCDSTSFCSVHFLQLKLRASLQDLALCALISYQHLQCVYVKLL